jgi:hypothetical protein
MFLRLLKALLAGLMVQLVHLLAPRFVIGKLSHTWSKALVVSLITLIAGRAGGATTASLYRTEGGSPAVDQMVEVIGNHGTAADMGGESPQRRVASARAWSNGCATMRGAALPRRRRRARALLMLIGLIIGSFVALREATPRHAMAPLAQALCERVHRLGEAFSRVVFAQMRISALNALLTWIYLALILPGFGIELPFVKTMVIVTFVVGLLPVLGNLISNTVIVVISLSHSLYAAAGSLAFLVIIHKLEYFVNARIIGGQIKARAWELLIVMLAMEAAFGVPGVIAAPVFYAYIKKELSDRNLI